MTRRFLPASPDLPSRSGRVAVKKLPQRLVVILLPGERRRGGWSWHGAHFQEGCPGKELRNDLDMASVLTLKRWAGSSVAQPLPDQRPARKLSRLGKIAVNGVPQQEGDRPALLRSEWENPPLRRWSRIAPPVVGPGGRRRRPSSSSKLVDMFVHACSVPGKKSARGKEGTRTAFAVGGAVPHRGPFFLSDTRRQEIGAW